MKLARRSAVGLLPLYLVTAAGCAPHAPAAREGASAPAALSHFDAAASGSIQGTVRWSGPVPIVPPIEGWLQPEVENGPRERQAHPDPNAPAVRPGADGLTSAVVFLRQIRPSQARPWDLPPVRVDMRGGRLHVVQGADDSSYGFVRRGDSVEVVSRDRTFHALHADGAAFFSLTFPEPDSPLSRRFDTPGVVELTSAAGYPWMRAYLFVTPHPYFARTSDGGRFALDRVPEGEYQVACWVPSWVEARHDRDPETGLIVRRYLRPAVEKAARVHVTRRCPTEVSFSYSAADFP